MAPASKKYFIELVREFPHLYDTSSAGYHDTILKHNSWASVSRSADMSVEACKKLWKHLRDRFRIELKGNKRKGRDSTWPYMELMSFLKSSSNPRRTIGNMEGLESQNFECKILDSQNAEARQPLSSQGEEEMGNNGHLVSPSSEGSRTSSPTPAMAPNRTLLAVNTSGRSGHSVARPSSARKIAELDGRILEYLECTLETKPVQDEVYFSMRAMEQRMRMLPARKRRRLELKFLELLLDAEEEEK